MEQNKPYICPKCGAQGLISNIVPLVGNVRYDSVTCECGTSWRVYYQFENSRIEIMSMSQDPIIEGVDVADEVQGE